MAAGPGSAVLASEPRSPPSSAPTAGVGAKPADAARAPVPGHVPADTSSPDAVSHGRGLLLPRGPGEPPRRLVGAARVRAALGGREQLPLYGNRAALALRGLRERRMEQGQGGGPRL